MRVNKPILFLLGLVLFLSFSRANAQVSESAIGASRHLWVGVEGSDFNPDYNKVFGRLAGVGIYADYTITQRFSAEGEVRLLDLKSPAGQTQKNFLIGPLFNAYQYHHFSAYGKILVGIDTITYPYFDNTTISRGNGSYFAFAPGGGVEYRFSHRWKVRGEYEYHIIPGAPGIEITYPFPSTGLSPSGFSAGIAYHIF